MTRRTLLLLVALFAIAGPAVSAHDDFRVIGTITRTDKATIDVRNNQDKTVTIRLNGQTEVTRDKKKVAAAELKIGQSVVVDAYGDSEADLLALGIRIVPPIRRTK
jgi:hypothetical protein